MPVESVGELYRLMEALLHPHETPVSWRIARMKKEYEDAWKETK